LVQKSVGPNQTMKPLRTLLLLLLLLLLGIDIDYVHIHFQVLRLLATEFINTLFSNPQLY
jgi:hypothetical protein